MLCIHNILINILTWNLGLGLTLNLTNLFHLYERRTYCSIAIPEYIVSHVISWFFYPNISVCDYLRQRQIITQHCLLDNCSAYNAIGMYIHDIHWLRWMAIAYTSNTYVWKFHLKAEAQIRQHLCVNNVCYTHLYKFMNHSW